MTTQIHKKKGCYTYMWTLMGSIRNKKVAWLPEAAGVTSYIISITMDCAFIYEENRAGWEESLSLHLPAYLSGKIEGKSNFFLP